MCRQQGLESAPLFPVLKGEKEGGSRSSTPTTQSPKPAGASANTSQPGTSTSADGPQPG